MQAAEAEEEPDETEARETFASRFDSGAFAFGRAAGSFEIASGVVDISKVPLEGDVATVLAGARLDLGAMSLASDWTVRVESEDGANTQPYVTLSYSGPLSAPERRVDLNPLLDQLRGRFLQRQLEKLEVLEEERRRAHAAAAELAARSAAEAKEANLTGSVTALPSEVPGSGVAPANLPAGTPSPVEGGSPPDASEVAPPAEAGTLRDSDLLIDAAPGELAPDLGAAAPELDGRSTEPFGPPLNLIPEEPAPQPAAPPRPRQRERSATPLAPPAQPPPVAPSPAELYKTLPNGVVVKIR
jgi:hypothetical protein